MSDFDEPPSEETTDPEALSQSLQDMASWEVDQIDPNEATVPEEPVPEEPKDNPVPSQSLTPPEAASPPPLLRIIEAMLFVGDGPLTEARACGTIRGLTPTELHETIDTLSRDYRAQGRPYYIKLKDQGYVLELRSRYAPIKEKMHGTVREARLSAPAIEVLALVAYRQPTTRQEVDSLRGADSNSLLRQLVRHGLIAVHREKDQKEPTYITTKRFLELFHLSSLEDLPQTQELRQI